MRSRGPWRGGQSQRPDDDRTEPRSDAPNHEGERPMTRSIKAAALAAGKGIKLSSHLFPEVSSHLLAVTPTQHWLEFVDWAAPILAEPLQVTGGAVISSNRPGTGISWNKDAVKRFQVV